MSAPERSPPKVRPAIVQCVPLLSDASRYCLVGPATAWCVPLLPGLVPTPGYLVWSRPRVPSFCLISSTRPVTWPGLVHMSCHLCFWFRGGTPDKKMSKGHLPRVVYHQVYNVYEDEPYSANACSLSKHFVACASKRLSSVGRRQRESQRFRAWPVERFGGVVQSQRV